MKGQEKLCAKLWSAFLRKWWFMIGLAVVLVLLGVIVLIFFMAWINAFIDMEIVLKPSSQTYKFWSKPPIEPYLHVYIYNVTNADEFLNNGSKPSVEELGPYVYRQNWEKMNITFNENGTVSFNPSKIYTFDEEASYGSVDDVVVVPNIPMLSATSQSKHAARFLRLAMASIMDILKIKPFVEVSVDQLLWGYEDPLLRLAKDVTKDAKLPYEEFGLFYKKNGTSEDRITVFTGASDITKFGLIDKFNGRAYLPHWKTDTCNRLNGSDGSLFPPHISKDDMIYIYDKDLCRLLPLKYEKDIVAQGNVSGYRFTPPENVFASVENNPDNECFCPGGPPCAPNGLFNVSLCQYDSPVLLSFPHFYMADDSFREAFDGISPPDPEKHKLYVDVSPVMGTALAARARVQINLAVSQVIDIKQVANFPDIIFPIMWFEEGVVGLPEEATKLMKLASDVPPVARSIVSAALFIVGIILLIVATWRLIKAAHAHSTLHLNTPIYGKDVKRENNVPLSNIMK